MNFIMRMAWRDSRRARRRLILFSFSIVLGIAALVAIGSFTANLRQAIEDQAKTLLAADVAVGSRQPLDSKVQAELDAFASAQAREVSFSSMAAFPSRGDQARLVSVRALGGAYPFYGDAVTQPADALMKLQEPGSDGALLDETLLAQFGLAVGDPVKLGEKVFRIVGSLEKMPGESTAVANLSPRVFIPWSRLAETKLIQPGSLVRYQTFLRVAPDQNVNAWVESMKQRFGSMRLNFETVDDRKRDLGQGLKNVYAFLSLVGFIALFLGGIGVASAISAHIREKVPTVAILRCLGASARQSFSIYLLHGLGLGLIGAVSGALLGVAVQRLVPLALKDFLPFQVAFFVSWFSVARGVVAGLMICVGFCLIPLIGLRRVSPLRALRSGFEEERRRFDPWQLALYAAIAVAIVAFAIAQTGRVKIGVAFAGGLLATLGALALVALLLAWSARKLSRLRFPYVVRQGLANLHRPHNRTILLLLSLGLGTFLIVVLALSRETLLADLRGTGTGARPNILFFDIQDDQIAPLTALLAREGSPALASAPIVTMRLSTWKGRSVQSVLDDKTLKIPAWTLRREYRSTFRDHLTNTEHLERGTFVSRIQEGTTPVPISVETDLARDMQIEIGDELGWDVQGVTIETRVASLRSVDWRRLQPNFFVVFPAGVLESAPKTFVAAARTSTPDASATLQRDVVRAFPNVSAIDLAAILQTLDNIFSKVEFVVRFMALFTVATGIAVLIGAVFTGRYQRLRETVLLRTLGATRQQLLNIQLVEYAVLGLLGALTGGGLAYAGNALLARFLFHVPIVGPPAVLGWSTLGVTLTTLATGFFAHRTLARESPLEVLRSET